MAPWTFTHTTDVLLTVTIGLLFGFVLERAGFGNARNLAAQFYLYDMRVLKVMFTAIVTAMLLVFLSSALGWLDFRRVWVPPTYLGPAVTGGLLLGVGFIIGGYCPGTSLVSAATLKLDGMAFAGGVMAGLLVFGETVPSFWQFFHGAGVLGRVTLPELLGVDAGVVVLGVVVMALGAFWMVERVEQWFSRSRASDERRGEVETPGLEAAETGRRLRRLLLPATVATGVLLAVAIMAIGQPSVERKVVWARGAIDKALRERVVHIDPAELLGLMHNNQVPLVLVDVRGEEDFNRFHLLDARRASLEEIRSGWPANLPAKAIVVVMSSDEQAAEEAWKRLAVQLSPQWRDPAGPGNRTYILAGGINRWLDIYQARLANIPGAETPAAGDDRCRHVFPAALGSRHAASRPAVKDAPPRSVPAKVKALSPTRQPGGGCG